MKLKDGAVSKLALLGQSHILIPGPMTPCMVIALHQSDVEHVPQTPAHFELSWSGLQLLCVHPKMTEYLVANNKPPFALEGNGFITVSRDLVEGWTEDGKFEEESLNILIQLISQVIGYTLHPEQKDKEQTIVVQLQRDQEPLFPKEVCGFQVCIMMGVEEGAWVGMYQLHTAELARGTEFYQQYKKMTGEQVSAEMSGNFADTRVLN